MSNFIDKDDYFVALYRNIHRRVRVSVCGPIDINSYAYLQYDGTYWYISSTASDNAISVAFTIDRIERMHIVNLSADLLQIELKV